MTQIRCTVDHTSYNRLPSVEEADKYVRAKNSINLIQEELGPIYKKYNAHRHWGVGLIHHHWSIGPNEFPGEVVGRECEDKVYITSPAPLRNLGDYRPSFMALSNSCGEMQALEFSSDLRAIRAWDFIESADCFVSEVADALRRHDLQDEFGLISLRDETFSDNNLMEYTGAERKSVVRIEPSIETKWDDFIQTAWVFYPESVRYRCKPSCFRTCNTTHHSSPHQKLHDPNG